jgi:hypothetical protein
MARGGEKRWRPGPALSAASSAFSEAPRAPPRAGRRSAARAARRFCRGRRPAAAQPGLSRRDGVLTPAARRLGPRKIRDGIRRRRGLDQNIAAGGDIHVAAMSDSVPEASAADMIAAVAVKMPLSAKWAFPNNPLMALAAHQRDRRLGARIHAVAHRTPLTLCEASGPCCCRRSTRRRGFRTGRLCNTVMRVAQHRDRFALNNQISLLKVSEQHGRCARRHRRAAGTGGFHHQRLVDGVSQAWPEQIVVPPSR